MKQCYSPKGQNLIAFLLLLALIFVLGACSQSGSGSTGSAATGTPSAAGTPSSPGDVSQSSSTAGDVSLPNIADADEPQSDAQMGDGSQSGAAPEGGFIFQVNSDSPVFDCTYTYLAGIVKSQSLQKIVISDANTDVVIQTIIPSGENKVFLKESVITLDVNFDGNLDLLVPLKDNASGMNFDAYIWDAASKQFVETPSFRGILNPAVNSADRQILSFIYDSSAVARYYTMFSYTNNQFVQTNQFSYDLATNDPDPVNGADHLLHCVETKGGADNQTTVNDFYVSIIPNSEFDTNDPKFAPYFTPGSFWDLYGSRWQCPFVWLLFDGSEG